MSRTPRALFILKRREDYSENLTNFTSRAVATGMYNSAKFVNDMLNDAGIKSKMVTVIDNNSIDKEVKNYSPTHVFIEGFWVVPEKFDVLKPLHPAVNWFVRCHSELPFLSQEGNAINWAFEYFKRGIGVTGNSPRINRELSHIAKWSGIPDGKLDDLAPMLPNYYPVDDKKLVPETDKLNMLDDKVFDIGCFGAIRLMKNQLMQAFSAVEFAKKHHRKLRFHINQGRVENGANTLKNLVAFFDNLKPDYELVQHPWAPHAEFVKTIKTMDICMQVSFSETFNIVTADAVNAGVPIVISSEVYWAYPFFADPNSSDHITKTMTTVWNRRDAFEIYNRDALKKFSQKSKLSWVAFFRNHP